MAFPKLLQKLFQNAGSGDKLNSNIIPDDVVKVNGNGDIVIDGAVIAKKGWSSFGSPTGVNQGGFNIYGVANVFPSNTETNLEGGEISLFKGNNGDFNAHLDVCGNHFRVFGNNTKSTNGQPYAILEMDLESGSLTYSGYIGETAQFASHLVTPPCGSIVAFAGTTNIPRGWLICNGAAISRTQYPSLFNLLGTRWGAGDGSTTFNIPNLEEYYLEGTNSKDWVGVKRDAGLPQLHGQIDDLYGGVNLSVTGVFSTSNIIASGGYSKGGKRFAKLTFDAQAYNSIYGKSTSVYPNAYRVLYLIKSGGA